MIAVGLEEPVAVGQDDGCKTHVRVQQALRLGNATTRLSAVSDIYICVCVYSTLEIDDEDDLTSVDAAAERML